LRRTLRCPATLVSRAELYRDCGGSHVVLLWQRSGAPPRLVSNVFELTHGFTVICEACNAYRPAAGLLIA
jgi:hypothetical protein